MTLGAYRARTHTMAGGLEHCAARAGEPPNPTGANAGQTPDFLGHLDMRETCNRLPLATGTDWLKAARVASEAILHAVEDEERTSLEGTPSVLDELITWQFKAPRLDPSTPIRRDFITNSNCIHLVRSPTEIACLLQVPYEINERFDSLRAIDIEQLSEELLKRLFAPPFYHCRAKGKELPQFFSLPEFAFWQAYCHGRILGLEAGRLGLQHPRGQPHELNGAPAASSRTIFDLQRRTAVSAVERDERQSTTSALKAVIEAHEATIADLRRQTAALAVERDERRATTSALEATIEAQDSTIQDLLDSTSWKVTEPLRVVSRTYRRSLRSLRRALRLVYGSSTVQTSQAFRSLCLALARPRSRLVLRKTASPIETIDTVSNLIRESKRRRSPVGPPKLTTLAPERRLKVSIIAWDLAHNPLGRAYLIADALRNDYDVEIVGSTFPRFGNDIWKPLRNCSRVTIKSAPGDCFPTYFRTMQALAENVEGDVLFVSKPRLPSLELAILAKIRRNRPIILDIDDDELSFFENREPLSLDELMAHRAVLDADVPYGEAWTRYCESLIPHVEHITVSNKELRKRYGGEILPHIRDERDFDPTIYPRNTIRRALGFAPDDKVILFAGTPRMHKGLSQLVTALRKLDRPTYKLLVVGSPADGKITGVLRCVDPNRVTMLPVVPFSDLPGYLCAADLVALLQDEQSPPSAFQMPAKFTDALSMGIPILASNAPPLANLANDGLVELLGNASPAQKIDEIFLNYKKRKSRATGNRSKFDRDYSYAGNLPRLKSLIQQCYGSPKPVHRAFRDLIAYQQSTFGTVGRRLSTIPTVHFAHGRSHDQQHARSALAQRRIVRARRRSKRSYVDDKLDIVFFWKQNDSGIYGRRQDMFVKYLARDPRVSRIFHFDAPMGLFQSIGSLSRAAPSGRWSHARLVARQTLRRRLGLVNQGKVKRTTYVYVTSARIPRFLKPVIPAKGDYLDFLGRLLKRHEIGKRRTILWVCPVNFHFPEIEERLDADLVVADVIDDEREWPVCVAYREKLTRNYEEVLGRSDLVLTNCESVYRSMRRLSHHTHLLPNAVELLEREARTWRKPRELSRLSGPVIGYAGNLHIARIDLDLLRGVVSQRPDWNFVFIGSMHKGNEIRVLEKYGNVHFLGVRVYEHALRYIRHFDVAMIPHVDNGLTKSMNPLKLYVYHALFVPVVSTPVANVGDFEKFVRIGRSPQEFIWAIDDCLRNNPLSGDLPHLRALLKENSWPQRVKRILEMIELELAEPPQIVSPKRRVYCRKSGIGQTVRCSEHNHRASFDRDEIATSM